MKIEIYKDNKKVKVSKKVTLTPSGVVQDAIPCSPGGSCVPPG
jgi:hypothetical protein